MKKLFKSVIRHNNPIIKNHVIEGVPVLPGMAYIDLILSLAQPVLNIEVGSCSISRLSIYRSLELADNCDQDITVSFEPVTAAGKSYWNIEVASATAAGIEKAGCAPVFASAELYLTNDGKGDDIDVSLYRNRPTQDIESVYKNARNVGLEHSGVMKVGGLAYLDENQCMVDVVIDEKYADICQAFVANPAVLDGVAMASGVLFDAHSDQLSLPTYYDQVELYEKLPSKCIALLQVDKNKHSHVLNIALYDQLGKNLAKLEGIAVVPVRYKTSDQYQADIDRSHGTIETTYSDDRTTNIRNTLVALVQQYIDKSLSSDELGMGFFDLGLESSQLLSILKDIENAFSIKLNPTVLFENSNLQELIQYVESSGADVSEKEVRMSTRAQERLDSGTKTSLYDEALDIAIVGISGKFPNSRNLDEYWENLKNGVNCVSEIPGDRWQWAEYYSEDRNSAGHHYSKWGGFIEGFDQFDPLFFNISPKEAELLDPQDRLFLEQCWLAMEDAGYTKQRLHDISHSKSGNAVGVFVGSMYQEYPLFAAEASVLGEKIGIDSGIGSISARVSFFWDFNGPCMTLDTACSSSLTAIHQACMALKSGQISAAIAGGVNLTIHPNKYLNLSEGQFISSKGHCASFGADGDGYIPGEGLGVVILKRLADAEKDNDQIYAVIKGAAINHGGRASGYTVPNPKAQAEVISAAISQAKVDPGSINYVEAHGTGTSLGDPIEVAGLTNAFNATRLNDNEHHCWLGSAKSNIGHCEAAAGIAGIAKIALQLKHKQIAPSIHSKHLNPHIEFSATPFEVNQELRNWPALKVDGKRLPRRAGISSFGAGGANAHFILEEYIAKSDRRQFQPADEQAVILSAKDSERLKSQAKLLLEYVQDKKIDKHTLSRIAYTLQVGREPLNERIAILCNSSGELVDKLASFVDSDTIVDKVFRGKIESRSLLEDKAKKKTVNSKSGTLSEICAAWVRGSDVDWNSYYGAGTPTIISLPSQPFLRERYWLPVSASSSKKQNGTVQHQINSLVQENKSDLYTLKFRSMFSGREFYFTDHVVAGKKMLPASAYIEMVQSAVLAVCDTNIDEHSVRIRNISWQSPVVFSDSDTELFIELEETGDKQFDFSVYTTSGPDVDKEQIHCLGNAELSEMKKSYVEETDLYDRIRRCFSSDTRFQDVSPEKLYELFDKCEIAYGPAHKGINSIKSNSKEAIAELILPESIKESVSQYTVHPGLLDSAFQVSKAIDFDENWQRKVMELPYSIDSIEVLRPFQKNMLAWLKRVDEGVNKLIKKYDIHVYDSDGNLCIKVEGSTTKTVHGETALSSQHGQDMVALFPVWNSLDLGENRAASSFARREVVLCGFSAEVVSRVENALKGSVDQVLNLEMGITTEYLGCLAKRFEFSALALYRHIKEILLKDHNDVQSFVQLVVPSTHSTQVLQALSGLLKTLHLENPAYVIQVVSLDEVEILGDVKSRLDMGLEACEKPHIRFQGNTASSQEYRTKSIEHELMAENLPWRENGVYVITGGAGGLGRIFSKEILQSAKNATVIVTGRSNAENVTLDMLVSDNGSSVIYRQLDLVRNKDVSDFVENVVSEFGHIDGVIHCAGLLNDNFIIKKSIDEFTSIITPKVHGTVNLINSLEQLARVDFLAMFSSVSGAIGKVGQADYSTGNAFLDALARYYQLEKDSSIGKVVSINWPLWRTDGMSMDHQSEKDLEEKMGMYAMAPENGVAAFYYALSQENPQVIIVQGNQARIERYFHDLTHANVTRNGEAARASRQQLVNDATNTDYAGKVHELLSEILSKIIKLPASRVNINEPFEHYGIDSIMIVQLTNELEKVFGSISKTIFFEYNNIKELSRYFLKNYQEKVEALFGNGRIAESQFVLKSGIAADEKPRRKARRSVDATKARSNSSSTALDVAIVGLSGRYPQAYDIAAFWENLKSGKDCIEEVPPERWDWNKYYSTDRTEKGRHYSRWGGFIEDMDKFDPFFFNITPIEASHMDPQERLFLEHAWMALEDAGYTRADFDCEVDNPLGRNIGVYAGAMFSDYQLFGAEQSLLGNPTQVGGSFASIANRVSYFLNANGPSMTIDTMCSSALTSMHIACQDLASGRTRMALAGAVNISIHPNKYLGLSAGQFVSSHGRCESYGEGGDGYVPGEGVGVVVLKRLSDAVRDNDHIYGVIKSLAINHGGKTNGYSVPNPNAQSDVISLALKQANIDARHISYIEGHGTGTKLGDPIEIAGLSKALAVKDTEITLGSVKSNIGHCESAAGIAGLTKILLQMKHKTFVPSLHSKSLNPNIDFSETPFAVNQTLCEWKQPIVEGREVPRIAGLSSFGAGGSNAHMVVSEYVGNKKQESQKHNQFGFVLSAKSPQVLHQYVASIIRYIDSIEKNNIDINIADFAYTMQVGREALEHRLAAVVTDFSELKQKLLSYLDGKRDQARFYCGEISQKDKALNIVESDDELYSAINNWIEYSKLEKVLNLWVGGLGIDWKRLYANSTPKRISAPTYPFSRMRYWLDTDTDFIAPGLASAQMHSNSSGVLQHPLLQKNDSNYFTLSYSGFLPSTSTLLHLVSGEHKELPGLYCLEIVVEAARQAYGVSGENAAFEVSDVRWFSRLIANNIGLNYEIELFPDSDDEFHFEIRTLGLETADNRSIKKESLVCCRGVLKRQPTVRAESSSLDLLQQLPKYKSQIDSVRSVLSKYELSNEIQCDKLNVYQAHNQFAVEVWFDNFEAQSHDAHLARFSLCPGLMSGVIDYLTNSGFVCADQNISDLRHIQIRLTSATHLWLVVEKDPSTNKIERLRAYTASGECVMDANGLGFADVGRATLSSEEDNRFTSYFTHQWHIVDSSLQPKPLDTNAEYLVLCNDDTLDIANEIKRNLFNRAVLLSVDELDDISVKLVPDYSKFVGCIDLVGCGGKLDTSLGWIGVLQALVQQAGRNGLELLAVTRRLESFKNASVNLAGANRVGLYYMLRDEYIDIRSRHIDVDDQVTNKALLQLISNELSNSNDERCICYRSHVRYARAYQKLHLDNTNTRIDLASPVNGKEPAVLITGGTGGLGYACAEHFVAKYGLRRLILTGTTPLPDANVQDIDALSSREKRQHDAMQSLEKQGAEVIYLQANFDSDDKVQSEEFARELLRINETIAPIVGMVHCAGKIDLENPAFIRKPLKQIARTLAPKVAGLNTLLTVANSLETRFIALFSSISAAIGRLAVGQSDYVLANTYMDYVCKAYANTLPLYSIQWPSWKEVGMAANEKISRPYKSSRLLPITTMEGMDMLDRILAGNSGQVTLPIVSGSDSFDPNVLPEYEPPKTSTSQGNVSSDGMVLRKLVPATHEWLIEIVSNETKIEQEQLDIAKSFGDFGIDSVLLAQVSRKVAAILEVEIDPSILYEYTSINEFGTWLAKNFADELHSKLLKTQEKEDLKTPTTDNVVEFRAAKSTPNKTRSRFQHSLRRAKDQNTDIAVVGMSCQFAGAENLDEYWELLKNGRCAFNEIPRFRFDREIPGYAGLLQNHNYFDPDYFLISDDDANSMDPQALLILEESLKLFCHAGYTLDEIKGSSVGVYLGGRSQLQTNLIYSARNPIMAVGQNYLATNVSQFFDLKGPSMVIDTACSSALVSMNLGIDALLNGEISSALVGGVSIFNSDFAFNLFNQRSLLSKDSHFHIFDSRASGIILGEGAGVVLLKTMEQAIKDNDTVYATIKALSINNDGRTAGPATPNMEAQKTVMTRALNKAKLTSEDIDYLDVNGSGSEVTDLLELKAIQSAYRSSNKEQLRLGSIKPNIGHTLCAEGISSFIKVALMAYNKSWVPFLSGQKPMKYFNMENSPFVFNRAVEQWSKEHVMALNSFADGGTNAHVLVTSANNARSEGARTPLDVPVLNKREVGPEAGAAKAKDIRATNKTVRNRWKKTSAAKI